MNCFEAQSKIISFIENKLSDAEALEFVHHVRSCEDCSEELEMYYIMLVGMKQLDNDEDLSTDFKKDLNKMLSRAENKAKGTRGFKYSTVVVFVLGILLVLTILYRNFLNLVYEQEQQELLAKQGQYYYEASFEESILKDERILIKDPYEEEIIKDDASMSEYYKNIRNYLLEQEILNEGEEIENE